MSKAIDHNADNIIELGKRLDKLEKKLNREILWLNSFKLELERITMSKIDKLDQKIIDHLEEYHPLKKEAVE